MRKEKTYESRTKVLAFPERRLHCRSRAGNAVFCLQIFTGGGINYGLYAIIIVMPATNYTLKALKTRSSRDILVAAFFILFVLCLSTGHIYNLIVK